MSKRYIDRFDSLDIEIENPEEGYKFQRSNKRAIKESKKREKSKLRDELEYSGRKGKRW